MKKKILFVLICLFSLMRLEGVRAEVRACTEDEINSARATLSSSSVATIPIPSLGRTGATGHANIYKMNLTNKQNGTVNNSFCLDSGKTAPGGTVYKIHHELEVKEWYKAYQYAITYKDDEIKYYIAQAVFWILRGEEVNGSKWLTSDNIAAVVKDIYVNKNCETLIGSKITDSRTWCDNIRNNSTNSTDEILTKAGILGNVAAFANITKETLRYMTYSDYYNGKLYYWIEENSNDINDGIYQGMVAPLDCSGGKPDEYQCTDRSGTVHVYTDEYNACVTDGTPGSVCKTRLDSLYCGDNPYGVVVHSGSAAVCTNSNINTGSYFEEVDTTVAGNAIVGKGEPEKNLGSYCNLFCLENSAQQIFPGNVRPAVSSGTYIIWPTSEATLSSTFKNHYPLKFSGQKTCYVVMSGTGNPVNTTDINAVYNNLVSAVVNQYGSFARRYYESSRVSGGCDHIYRNEPGGACGASYNEMMQAKNNLDNYRNSDTYKNALREQQEVNSNNSNLCEHDTASHRAGGVPCTGDYCTEIGYFCSDPDSEPCRIIKQQCEQQTKSGCTVGTSRSLSAASQAALTEDMRLESIYNDKVNKYNSCQEEKNACNAYTESVNKVIQFANEIKSCATYTPSCSGSSCEIYNFATNVDLSWGDTEYGRTIYDSQLEKTINYSLSINGDGDLINVDSSFGFNAIKTKVNTLITQVRRVTDTRQIIANVGVTYSLPTSGNLLYNYVVKRNDRYVSQTEMPSSDANYTTIGFSNLPISFNANPTIKYNLILSNIKFGDNGGQYTPSNYVCNYEVTKTLPTSCICPVGTKYEGKDLSSIIIDKGITCYEAQQNYCDIERTTCPDDPSIDLTSCISDFDYFTCYDKYCRSDITKTKYCPDKPGIELSTCLNNYSYSYCYNLLCVDPDISEDGYKCKNTLGVDGEMDITSCVYTKMAQGLSLNDAINECDSLICPLSGLRIIYRTISLENPFPGKNISNKVLGFNDDVKGRFPGTNWNDLTLVRKHILTSRGYDGSAIYQEEPLYTFVLNTGTINAIRRYNETREASGGYADYTLDCKLSHSRACISDFVHNPDLSGLVGGVCSSATGRSNFYLCSGD